MRRQTEWALCMAVLATMASVAPVNAQQTADALEVPAGRVRGRVLDAEGIVVVEASVLLVDREVDGPLSEAPRQEVSTDGDGRFLFDDVEPGSYLLLVEIPEAPIPSRYFDVAPGADYEAGDVRLAPTVWLSGHVVAGDGAPVGGISVRCRRGPSGWTTEHATTRTDSEGRYRCGPVAGGETVGVFLDAPTAVTAVRDWAAPVAGGEADGPTLLYQPGAAVLFSATDTGGNVIPVAVLSLSGIRARLPPLHVEEVDGEQLYQGIPPGSYELFVRADGFYSAEPLRVDLVPGRVFEHAVELHAPVTATLTVRVMVEGEILEGAEITASTEVDGLYDYRTGTTDAAGETSFEAFPVGPASIIGSYVGLRRLDMEFAVAMEGTALAVTLEPYAQGSVTVRGRLVDAQSRPVAGSSVGLTTHGYSPMHWPDYHVETDSRGNFEARFVAENFYRLCANEYSSGDPVCFEDLRVLAHTDPEPLRLTLPDTANLSVRLRSASDDELPTELWVRRAAYGRGRPVPGTEGEYRFRDLGPGDWIVGATVADSAYELGTVVLVAGDDHTAEYDYAPRLGALTGTVLVNGSPLAGGAVRVSFGGRGGPSGRTVTDSHGRFALGTLLAGEAWILVYRADGRRMHEQDLAIGPDEDLVIDIRTQRLRGLVRGRSGRPLGDARVRARAWGTVISHENNEIEVAPDGSFETWDLAETEWSFTVSAPGHRTRTVTYDVSQDRAPEELVVDLIPEAPLRVRVEPLDGRVPDQVRISLCPTADPCDSDDNHWTVRPDSSGNGVWAEAPEGNWYASIWTGFERRDGLPITIPGEPLRIDRQRPIGRLIVRLPEFYGVAVPLTLQLFTPEGHQAQGYWGGRRTAFTSPGYGELRASQLVAGEYLARVTASDGRVWESAVTVEPIEQTVLFLRSETLAQDPLGTARR